MTANKQPGSGVYLVLHGHFYQPPRENPWIETIEREIGAQPYRNWNERIADECYRRNGRARIFDDLGYVTAIVNNYRALSFNFGPTLLSWLQQFEPDIYRCVLQADRLSLAEHGGHGNAIAQGYSHAILPLCNDRDRRTQLRWGLYDFQVRFGRRAEAMWLPETAIDQPTVDALIDEGLRYVILAPGQARRVRPLGKSNWTDVSGARIDPRMPYRLFSRARPERFIDAFFYDGPVSHAISFEGILSSSQSLLDKLQGAVDGRDGPQLIHGAVDGETFGHHHRHADRALAYALSQAAAARGFTLTNYGQFLELCPPTHEVELEPGPNGEGTAWSCSHGVGRWCRDCGCHAGAPAGWNQAWRTPLRAAVSYVRDEAARLFEEMGGELLADVWQARDDYIGPLLDPSAEARQRFIQQHGRGAAVGKPVQVLRLLEMQRHSLLAQTSCGWFFNDISGLEAIQVMRYAARAVQLIEELSGRAVESRLLELLGEARSNLPDQGTGADIYRTRALPAAIDARRIVAQHAITGLHQYHPPQCTRYGFRLRELERRDIADGTVAVHLGRIQVEFLRTSEMADLTYGLIHFGSHEFHCAVRSFAGHHSFREFATRLEELVERASVTELLRAIDAHFGESYFSLADLLAEEREQVLESLFGHLHESFGQLYAQLYEMHRRSIGALIDAGFKMPEEFRMAAEYALTHQLLHEIQAQRGSIDPGLYARACELVAEARSRGYRIDKSASEAHFGRMLDEIVEQLVAGRSAWHVAQATQLLDLAEQLELELPLDRAQDMVYDMLAAGRADGLNADPPQRQSLQDLLRRLRLASTVATATAAPDPLAQAEQGPGGEEPRPPATETEAPVAG